jgi:hypothetical protein
MVSSPVNNVHAHNQKTVLAQPHTMKQLGGVKQQLHVMSDITKQKHPEPYHAPHAPNIQQPITLGQPLFLNVNVIPVIIVVAQIWMCVFNAQGSYPVLAQG